jgi:hypothetical protein
LFKFQFWTDHEFVQIWSLFQIWNLFNFRICSNLLQIYSNFNLFIFRISSKFCCSTNIIGSSRNQKREAVHVSGKSYAPPISGTEPRSARVGAMLGRPVNTAAAGFFLFCVVFYVFSFSFSLFLFFFLKILNIFKIQTFF